MNVVVMLFVNRRPHIKGKKETYRDGVLVVRDTERCPLGIGYLVAHRHHDFGREYRALENDKKD